MKNKDDALKLAGKLATSVGFLLKSDLVNLSERIKEVEKDLYHYDRYIIDWAMEDNKK